MFEDLQEQLPTKHIKVYSYACCIVSPEVSSVHPIYFLPATSQARFHRMSLAQQSTPVAHTKKVTAGTGKTQRSFGGYVIIARGGRFFFCYVLLSSFKTELAPMFVCDIKASDDCTLIISPTILAISSA